jgi:hypothetical protein
VGGIWFVEGGGKRRVEPHNFYAPHQNHSGNEVSENDVDGACEKYSAEDKHRILVAKPEGKSPLGSPDRRGRNNIEKKNIKGIRWINLIHNMEKWHALLITVMNLRVW